MVRQWAKAIMLYAILHSLAYRNSSVLLVWNQQFSPETGRALRRLTRTWSYRLSAGRCCGCARVHVVDAGEWQRLSEDTGDTLVKDKVIAGGQGSITDGGAWEAASVRNKWAEEQRVEAGRQQRGKGRWWRTEDGGRGDKSTQKAIVRFGIFKQAA